MSKGSIKRIGIAVIALAIIVLISAFFVLQGNSGKVIATDDTSHVITEEYYRGVYIGPEARGKVTTEDVDLMIQEYGEEHVQELGVWNITKAE